MSRTLHEVPSENTSLNGSVRPVMVYCANAERSGTVAESQSPVRTGCPTNGPVEFRWYLWL